MSSDTGHPKFIGYCENCGQNIYEYMTHCCATNAAQPAEQPSPLQESDFDYPANNHNEDWPLKDKVEVSPELQAQIYREQPSPESAPSETCSECGAKNLNQAALFLHGLIHKTPFPHNPYDATTLTSLPFVLCNAIGEAMEAFAAQQLQQAQQRIAALEKQLAARSDQPATG